MTNALNAPRRAAGVAGSGRVHVRDDGHGPAAGRCRRRPVAAPRSNNLKLAKDLASAATWYYHRCLSRTPMQQKPVRAPERSVRASGSARDRSVSPRGPRSLFLYASRPWLHLVRFTQVTSEQ